MTKRTGQVGQYRKKTKNKRKEEKHDNNKNTNNDKLNMKKAEDSDEDIDMTISNYLDKEDLSVGPTLDARARRIAIAFVFESLGAPDDCEPTLLLPIADGDENSSKINCKIREVLSLPRWADTSSICQQYRDCKAAGIKYTGEKRVQSGIKLGRPPLLCINSIEAIICADTQEDGFSTALTWHAINLHRRECCMPSVTKAAVIGLIKQLKPKISLVRKVSQGNRNPDSHWAVARWLFSTQFLIRVGKLESQQITIKNEIDGKLQTFIPDYWNKEKLSTIKLSQIAWWDETHRKCTIGGLSGAKEYYLKFPRDEEGRFDPNGKYSDSIVTQLKVKFAQEARFCLGVVALPKDNIGSNGTINNDKGELTGKRLPPFIYSGKVILTIADWRKKEMSEIQRVKSLQKNPTWVTSTRINKVLYLNDGVHLVKAVGILYAKKLNVAGINTVQDLIAITDNEIADVVIKSGGLSVKNILKFRTNALASVVHDTAPMEVDYRLADDPYLAKFGKDNRKKEISKSLLLSGNICITDMITHLFEESKKVFEGTIHQSDWYFWHDALSLMTAKETITWMKEQGYYDHWLLPELDLYRDFPEVKAKYDRRPIGDTPESMPLDNNLNKDLHDDVDRQIAATKSLAEDDDRKFSMSTPKRATAAYLRVWESVGPTPRRIVEDVCKVLQSWEDIRLNKGGYVDRIQRKGKRELIQRASSTSTTTNHGGLRKRKLPTFEYGEARLHVHAQETVEERLSETRNLQNIKNAPETETRVSEFDEPVSPKIT